MYTILKFSDRYSYSIYLVHKLFILSPFTLLNFTNVDGINIAISTVTILAAGIILKDITGLYDKKLCHVIESALLPRKEKI